MDVYVFFVCGRASAGEARALRCVGSAEDLVVKCYIVVFRFFFSLFSFLCCLPRPL